VRDTCRLLKESGCDAIWLVNINVADTKELLKIARPMGLKLLPGLGEIEPRNRPQTAKLDPEDKEALPRALDYYRKTIPAVVQGIGEDRDGILAWVLGDEPHGGSFSLLEPMREIFAEADHGRPVITVTMWPQTPQAIEKTRLTTFCVDLYPFFGPKDPNGPHTPQASRNFYTHNLQRMVEPAGRDGRVGWVMPMCFADVWGPWEMADDGSTVALPGAYIHWRTPTLAEMRWQIWEGLRNGVKGVLFYVLLGVPKGRPDAKPVEQEALKPVLAKERIPIGFDALLDFRGRPTPQFREVAFLFRALDPHRPLLRRLAPTQVEWVASGKDAQVGNFTDPTTGQPVAVVVNPDFEAAREVELVVGTGVKKVVDVLTGKELKLEPLGWAGGNFRIGLRLDAGAGALLQLTR